MLGKLHIHLRGRQYYTVFGGPFRDCPSNMKGVKMAREINKECDVDIPTEDFQTPDPKLLHKGLEQAVKLIIAGEPVYVGCMGGKGRTGLFLAVLAKAFKIKKPVQFVRTNYYSHAVETSEQMAFVKKFPINPRIHILIKEAREKNRWKFWTKEFWQTSLTRIPEPTTGPDIVKHFDSMKTPLNS